MKKIVILGAGISGLSLGWFLKKRFGNAIDLILIEKQDRIGGLIRTQNDHGFLSEQGPRGFRPKGKGVTTLQLAYDLGLQNELTPADSSATKRFLLINNKLQQLPSNPLQLLSTTVGRQMLLPCIKEIFSKASKSELDESIDSFMSRHFGQKFTDTIIDPFISGIFAGNTKELSMRACFPLLFEWEAEHGSLIKAALKQKRVKNNSALEKAALLSFKSGMSCLPLKIQELLDATILLSTAPSSLHFKNNSCLLSLKEKQIQADHIFSTLSAPHLQQLLPELQPLLQSFCTTSLATINIGFNQKLSLLKGFGYLIPSKEKENILGMTWDSSIFPEQNSSPSETRLTVMIGGSRDHNFHSRSHSEFKNDALDALQKHLSISASPNMLNLSIHSDSIPQYQIGQNKKLAHLKAMLSKNYPHLTLLGHSFSGVGINDCIENAKAIADAFVIN